MIRLGGGSWLCLVVLIQSGVATAASPQAATAHAFKRDATQLRRALETACSGAPVVQTACRLEAAAARLVEKVENPRCHVEVPAVLNECIVVYNSICANVGADYRLASDRVVAEALACTGRRLSATVDAFRRYQHRPAPIPQPLPHWNDHYQSGPTFDPREPSLDPRAQIPRAQSTYRPEYIQLSEYGHPSDLGHEIAHPGFSEPRLPSVPTNIPSGFGQRGYYNRPTPFPVPVSRPGHQPRIGQAILEAVLSEVLR
jgi:hypothetical protein